MEGMKEFPDNYFELAIVDPPYGSGLAEGGGCQGWFAKYREDNQDRENKELGAHFVGRGRSKRFKDMYEAYLNENGGGNTKYWNRFGQRFDRYKHQTDQQRWLPRQTLQSRFTIKEQTPNGTDNGFSQNGRNTKPKKLYRGMWRQGRTTLKNCFASHVIRSYGVAITSICHLQDAS